MNEQDGSGIRVRIVESEIAAEGSLISDAHVRDLRFGVSQRRRMLAHKRAVFQRVVRDASADPQHTIVHFKSMQPFDSLDVD